MKINIKYRIFENRSGLLLRPEKWDSYQYCDYDTMEECQKVIESYEDWNEYIILPVTNAYLD